MEAAKFPAIEVMQGQTLTLLKSHASRTRSLLSSHQEQLARNLNQYVKQKQEGS